MQSVYKSKFIKVNSLPTNPHQSSDMTYCPHTSRTSSKNEFLPAILILSFVPKYQVYLTG
jgi:hypothetical protein